MLVFAVKNKINYVALDNLDRLTNPGQVQAEFKLVKHGISFVVRALIYLGESHPFAITVHKVGDSTDCEKLSFPS